MAPFGIILQSQSDADPRVSITAQGVFFATSPSYESGYLIHCRWVGRSVNWFPLLTLDGDGVTETYVEQIDGVFMDIFTTVLINGSASLICTAGAFETAGSCFVTVYPSPAF